MGCQIFISYRRSDGSYPAYLLSSDLIDNKFSVFFDKVSLRSGPFPEQIINQIKGCTDFIMVITEDYFDNRIFNKDDWVYKEIELALKLHKNIIPYIIEKDIMDDLVLPSQIKQIFTLQRFVQTDITQFHAKNQLLIANFIKSEPIVTSLDEEIKNRISIYDANYGDEYTRLKIQSSTSLKFDKELLQRELRTKTKLKVLDVGCAHGVVGQSRFNTEKYFKVLGIDKSVKCIDHAEKCYANDKFRFRQMDIEASSFEHDLVSFMQEEAIEGFDIIFAALILHHLGDPALFLRKIRKYLNHNGILFIRGSDDGSKLSSNTALLNEIIKETSSIEGTSNRFLGRELFTMLVNNGFSDVQIYSFTTETSKYTFEQKQNLFQQAFSYRINCAKKQLELNPSEKNLFTFRKIEKLLSTFEAEFYKRDFWYCQHNYIAVARK